MPREEDEFKLRFYNSLSTWIDLDQLLGVFGLSRGDLADETKVAAGIRSVAAKVPTYVTLKDVKKRWGHGQEDIFPVAQFEKLWSDMTALPEVDCRFLVVPRTRASRHVSVRASRHASACASKYGSTFSAVVSA